MQLYVHYLPVLTQLTTYLLYLPRPAGGVQVEEWLGRKWDDNALVENLWRNTFDGVEYGSLFRIHGEPIVVKEYCTLFYRNPESLIDLSWHIQTRVFSINQYIYSHQIFHAVDIDEHILTRPLHSWIWRKLQQSDLHTLFALYWSILKAQRSQAIDDDHHQRADVHYDGLPELQLTCDR